MMVIGCSGCCGWLAGGDLTLGGLTGNVRVISLMVGCLLGLDGPSEGPIGVGELGISGFAGSAGAGILGATGFLRRLSRAVCC
jgi:hypothetical protein